MKLDFSWIPLLRAFESRLSWAESICRSRNIVFEVLDDMTASETNLTSVSHVLGSSEYSNEALESCFFRASELI